MHLARSQVENPGMASGPHFPGLRRDSHHPKEVRHRPHTARGHKKSGGRSLHEKAMIIDAIQTWARSTSFVCNGARHQGDPWGTDSWAQNRRAVRVRKAGGSAAGI